MTGFSLWFWRLTNKIFKSNMKMYGILVQKHTLKNEVQAKDLITHEHKPRSFSTRNFTT